MAAWERPIALALVAFRLSLAINDGPAGRPRRRAREPAVLAPLRRSPLAINDGPSARPARAGELRAATPRPVRNAGAARLFRSERSERVHAFGRPIALAPWLCNGRSQSMKRGRVELLARAREPGVQAPLLWSPVRNQ